MKLPPSAISEFRQAWSEATGHVLDEAEAKERALTSERVEKWLAGKEPKKVIYVKGKLVSIVL